jgi:hypothetical protein
MTRRYQPKLWRRQAELEKAANEILRADRRRREIQPNSRSRRASPAKPTEPQRYRLNDLPLLRRKGLIP